jgi:hypothetical protein
MQEPQLGRTGRELQEAERGAEGGETAGVERGHGAMVDRQDSDVASSRPSLPRGE